MNDPAPGQRRQALVNTVANTAANGWMILLSLVSLPLLLGGLGTDAFGTWVLLLTFSATSGWLSLADLGLGVATVRASAHHLSIDDRDGLSTVVGTSLTMYSCLAATCSLLFGIVAPWLLPDCSTPPKPWCPRSRSRREIFALQILFDLLSVGMMASLEGVQRLDLSRAVDTTNRTLTAIATVVVALTGGGLVGVTLASMGASIVTMVLALVLTRRGIPGRRTRSRAEARELLTYGAQVGVLRGAGVLHRTMDRIIVGIILGPAAVTIVEIATQLQNGIAALLAPPPRPPPRAHRGCTPGPRQEKLRELLLKGTKYSTMATTPVAVVVLVLAGPIIGFWVGPSFDAAVVPLALAMAYLISQTPFQVGSNLLQGMGKARSVIGPALAGVVVNLVASALLVNAIGVPGAFIGTLVGGLVLTPALLHNVLRQTELPLRPFLVEAVLPAVPMMLVAAVGAGVVLVLPLGDLVTVITGAAVGLALAGAVGLRWATSQTERQDLIATLRRSDR